MLFIVGYTGTMFSGSPSIWTIYKNNGKRYRYVLCGVEDLKIYFIVFNIFEISLTAISVHKHRSGGPNVLINKYNVLENQQCIAIHTVFFKVYWEIHECSLIHIMYNKMYLAA